MPRILFSKTGNAVWISHLDIMRLFQRAFKRSGFHLKHTQGFNPRPSVSIALPLSVGVESYCELLDFELEDPGITCMEIAEKLNLNLIDGVYVNEVYDEGAKLKYLKYLQCEIDLDYDNGIPDGAEFSIHGLFKQNELWIEKKSKRGITSQNIIPMIHDMSIRKLTDQRLRMSAMISCQEPSLNPSQLYTAIEGYLPQYKPDFYACRRCELFNIEKQIFR